MKDIVLFNCICHLVAAEKWNDLKQDAAEDSRKFLTEVKDNVQHILPREPLHPSTSSPYYLLFVYIIRIIH